MLDEDLLGEDYNIKADEIECSICLTDIRDTVGSEIFISRTKCGHFFHKNCLEEWIKKRKNCPVCRSKVLIRKLGDFDANNEEMEEGGRE